MKAKFHFFTILAIGCSATIWAVSEADFFMPLFWLFFLTGWILIRAPREFGHFFRRFAQIGLALLSVSLLQIIFRRQGSILLAVRGFPLIYSVGLREAILLWIRFMIIFILAFIFARVSLFEFLLFLNKIRISLQLSLLLLITLKFIPFIFEEAKKALWTIRFRGVDLGQLSLKQKYLTFRKLLMPLLYKGVHYASLSSHALELRGYGTVGRIKMQQPYPLQIRDYLVLVFIIMINFTGIFIIK